MVVNNPLRRPYLFWGGVIVRHHWFPVINDHGSPINARFSRPLVKCRSARSVAETRKDKMRVSVMPFVASCDA